MKRNGHASGGLLFIIAMCLCLPGTLFAQIKVLTSGGFSAPLLELLPDFEKRTGINVSTSRGPSQGKSPNRIGAQLQAGVAADVVIMSREGLDELIAEHRIVPGTDINLAQTPLGLSVRAGAPKPDISNIDAFKRTLLRANSITFPDSTTGIYLMTKLFPRLEIESELAGKITHTGVAAVVKGDAEIAIQPLSELLHVPGSDFVGAIPQEIQYVSVFSAALVSGSKEPKAAKRLIAFLASESATKVIQKSGMDRTKSR
jgi:molybdate transport system substrate-binding protein